MIERAEQNRKFQTRPCWSWSGAEALNFSEQNKLKPLIAILPVKQSSDEEILAFLVDLRAHFQRWLHQDELGPTRRQQTAALRALKSAGLRAARSPNCSREYQTLVRAFRQEIRPHIDQEQARMVLDTDWLELLETQPASQK